jgi:glycosyltransferase involved in cell wall biosynthesis
MKKISVVIPVYQNVGSIRTTCIEVGKAIEGGSDSLAYDFVLVNDGSTDGSWQEMEKLQREYPGKYTLVNLTRNFGQVAALLAGYRHATGQCVISMAADLQDPPKIVAEMISAWLLGNKLVIAVRAARNDGAINNFVSNLSWKILRAYAVPNLPEGGFDFFLMDRDVVNYYVDNPEQHIFIQGRLLYYGCAPCLVEYERTKRSHGKSQTSLSRKIKYLIDGFAGYSVAPLKVISILGVVLFLGSLLAAAIISWYVVVHGSRVEGWASLMVVVLFMNGIQLLAFGVIGEYLWRNVEESRKRPHYIIEKIVKDDE